MTTLPIDELRRLTVTGTRAQEALPTYNEKVAALVRADQTHLRVFFNRCLGSAHLHGIRTVDLEWDGYVWRVAEAAFIPTPHQVTSAKGMPTAGL